MKKLSVLLITLWAFSLLNAVPDYIVAIPTTSLKISELRNAVHSLAESGLEIYYYNEYQIIAGSNSADYPQAKLLCRRNSGNLYLVSKLGNSKDSAVSSAGKVLLDLDTSLLVQSNLDEQAFGKQIDNPSLLLKLQPIKFNQRDVSYGAISETRTDIQTLISYINADSVQSYIQHLEDYQTRYWLAPNHLAVATWIKDQYLRVGISNAYLQSYTWSNTTQYNPVATITGSVYPDVYIVISGHHDSITGGHMDTLRLRDPMYIAPGADDNASGTAATIEMARVMMATGFQPKCSIIFTAFSTEEIGHYGSQYFAQQALDNNLDIRMVVNLDMIANNNPGNTMLKILQYDGSLAQSQITADVTYQYTGMGSAWSFYNYMGTDSYSFWTQGFNTLTISEYNFSPWWHTDQDLTVNLDPVYCAQVIRAVTAVVATFANMVLAPDSLKIFDPGSGSSLLASWDHSPDPLVDHYNVYCGSSEGGLAFWQSTTGNQCLISGLVEGQNWCVGVSSVDTAGNEGYRILGYGVPLSLPRTPVNFIDNPQLDAINLSWSPNAELDLQSYYIYRSLDPDDVGSLIATVPAPGTSYTDSNLPGLMDYYCYRICAVDNQNGQSGLSAVVQSRPVSLDLGILVIDETRNYGGSSPFQPTDEIVDTYYDAMLEGYNVTTHLDLESYPDSLRMADIGIYSSILWHGNDFADVSTPGGYRDLLRQYIAWGGNVLFSLYHPGTAFEYNGGYPAAYEADSFICEVLGIANSDYSSSARFKYALPNLPAFPQLQVDSLKTLPAFAGHIFQVESILPDVSGVSVYSYGSDYPSDSAQGSLNGQTVAVLHVYGAGKALTLSFPLYNMQESSSRAMVDYVFSSLFHESCPVEDPTIPVLPPFTLQPNHPNPFSDKTTFSIETRDTISSMKVGIYNLKGQLVKTLYNGIPKANNPLVWDARDNHGNKVGSGIYFIRAQQNGQVSNHKILLLRQ